VLSLDEIRALYDLPLIDLLGQARQVHLAHHDPSEIQLCHLISIKTGGCSEDCKYCSQSSRYKTPIEAEPMMDVNEVVATARRAKEQGASRICLGAAWRQVRSSRQFDQVLAMVEQVSEMGVEVCCTLGMIEKDQIERLKEAGLYAYNHNLDTSERYYKEIITTRTYQDRIETLGRAAKAGLSVCSGGIIGMGEEVDDRLELLRSLLMLDQPPDSVPINRLVPVKGTPLEGREEASAWELLRMVCVARILFPKAMVRLAAGRFSLSESELALCIMGGANSLFVGDQLLTKVARNPQLKRDLAFIEKFGLRPRVAKQQSFLADRLEKREREGGLRQMGYRNTDLIDFASNDYLGVAGSTKIAEAVQRRFEELSSEGGIRPAIGATGSRLLTGNQPLAESLEQTIARYHGGQSSLLFNSGYAANTGLISALGTDRDAILLDSGSHASTWDGARLSRAKNYLVRHNDCGHLEQQLKRAREKHDQLFVCIESLYSMKGDFAPLGDIAALCRQYSAHLIVDEAHATGVMGPGGCGLAEGCEPVLARLYTFGKALGCHGAAVVGSTELRNYLINFCRTFIYTTAFPLHTLATLQLLYEELPQLEGQRQRLFNLIDHFGGGKAPIQSVPVGSAEEAVRISEQLRAKGFDVRAVRSPTVRRGQEMLRICLHSHNTKAEVDRLVAELDLHQLALCG